MQEDPVMPGSDSEQVLVTVVVLNYNGRDHLEYCLPSLLDLDFPRDRLELLVVDNGSTDGSADVVARFAPRVELLSSGGNIGFSAGNNFGARQARGRYVAFLNNDTRVSPGWLTSLCRTMDGAPNAAAVAGKLLSWDGSRLDFGRGIITFDGHGFQEGAGLPLDRDPHQQVAETFIPCGGNMLVRREVFLELGGFDEDYFAYLEDVDLAWRFWAAGHRVLLDPGAVAYHRSEGTSGRMDPFDRGFLFERNAFITAVKNLDREFFPRVFPAILLTLINRTMHLGPCLADREGLLGRYPFTSEGYVGDRGTTRTTGGDSGPPRGGRLGAMASRLWRWLLPDQEESRPSLTMDHPHSISQLRAVHYILENLDAIMEKRRQVQAKRRVADRKIFGRFPLHLVPTYPGDEELFQTRFFQWLLAVETKRKSLEEIQHSDE